MLLKITSGLVQTFFSLYVWPFDQRIPPSQCAFALKPMLLVTNCFTGRHLQRYRVDQNDLESHFSLWTLPSCSRKCGLFGLIVSDLREAWQSVSTISRLKLEWHTHTPKATKTIQTFRGHAHDLPIFFLSKNNEVLPKICLKYWSTLAFCMCLPTICKSTWSIWPVIDLRCHAQVHLASVSGGFCKIGHVPRLLGLP